ncbi:MAG: DUF455 family protein [Akkermansiaceae bacterium]
MSSEIREVAERVLYGQSLDEKLAVGVYKGTSPRVVTDVVRECGLVMPELPGRPSELMISPRGVDAGAGGGGSTFPKVNRMDEAGERGKMLHFLANHELLATELMALVLLKFPNAPSEFRQGVYETMREEQAHTLMYMRRMKECGMEFGELPVNDYFWRMVAPMECPMDFVSRLSLVFEQANLDYSLHYGRLFREVGDTGTAAVLDKIYQDEIGHVGHGLKWFRKWKDEGLTDWAAFKKQLHFPLTLARAKGMAPYDRAGRDLAGIDAEWVDELEVIEQSRGRTPVVHWFNPNEELAMAAKEGAKYQPKRAHALLEKDLGILPLAWARRDDVVLVDEMPSREHLVRLKRNGFVIPELMKLGADEELLERKIGGLKPWAWGPVASRLMSRYKECVPEVVDLGWMEWGGGDAELFSKRSGLRLAELLGEKVGRWCDSVNGVLDCVREFAEGGDVLLKAPLSSAGRGHLRLQGGEWTAAARAWLDKVLAQQGGVVVEPWLERVMDFSAQYEVSKDGIKLVGMTRVINDPAGRYLGTFVHHKWTSGLEPTLTEFLFREAGVMQLYKVEVPKLLGELLDDDYRGNFGVDAMVYEAEGDLQLRKVVEVNPRMTMGRVALELLRKSGFAGAGFYQILRKSKLGDIGEWLEMLGCDRLEERSESGMENTETSISCPLNDPHCAHEFIAIWHLRSNTNEVMERLFYKG